MRPSRVEINLSDFEENVRKARETIGDNKHLMAVVKADAYGHGAVAISIRAISAGADWLGVGIVEEGIELRNAGITSPIQILSQELEERVEEIVRFDLIPTVCSRGFLFALQREGERQKKKIPVMVMVDTGMGRYGVLPEEFIYFLKTARGLDNIVVIGAMSHLPSADTDPEFTDEQLGLFNNLLNIAESIGIKLKYRSIANSAAFLNHSEKLKNFNLHRLGLVLYGIPPIPGMKLPYRPVMRVKSKISFIKTIPPGHSVSYSRTFIAKRPTRVGVVPIGYADGYDRHLSNRGYMVVHGKRASIIGNVTMDATMIDLTGVPEARVGDEVLILGENISAWDIAGLIQTIPYEVVSRMGKRLPRIYLS
ncbi:alanine racemase [bacterium]|nr:MAG: alanine racemase [bacterium]